METNRIILLYTLLMTGYFASAQGLIFPPCAWYYSYDNAGNRTGRIRAQCASNSPTAKTDETGKEEITEPEILIESLYPNPTKDAFVVEFSKPLENVEFTVTDNTGKVIYKRKHSGNTVPIDLSGQAAGVYHVVYQTSKGRDGKSVVKIE